MAHENIKYGVLAETKELRAFAWDLGWIPCKNHPDRRCNRYNFIQGKRGRCASCALKRADGTWKTPQLKAAQKAEELRAKEVRAKFLKGERIGCAKHPDRKANPSTYVKSGRRMCVLCRHYNPDGTKKEHIRASDRRYRTSAHGKEQRRWRALSRARAKRIIENRT